MGLKTPLKNDTIELDSDTAALVLRENGTLEMYIPKGSDDLDKDMPPHAEAIAALGSYWMEHQEEILQWFAERVRH